MLEVIEVNITNNPAVIASRINNNNKVFTPFDILVATAFETGISLTDLIGESQFGHLAAARKLYSYLSCELTKETLWRIGSEINRDHSTILYNKRKIKQWLTVPSYRTGLINSINNIKNRLYNHV